MEVGRLPLSASQRGKLISAGYTTLASLSRLSPSHLARGKSSLSFSLKSLGFMVVYEFSDEIELEL